MTAQWHRFKTASDAAERLAGDVAVQLRRAAAERGSGSLVVSGGSTPLPFFHALRSLELPWSAITITLADERWVPTNSPDSNEKLVRQHLLTEGAHFIGLKNVAPTPHEGIGATDAALQAVTQPYDAVILGMGDDGHTASFFPKAPELKEALDMNNASRVAAITPPAYAPHLRMTQTLRALLNTRFLALHITGEKKQAVLEKALQPGDCGELPVRAILTPPAPPVAVYWAP